MKHIVEIYSMIVKKNFNLLIVISNIRNETLITLIVSSTIWFLSINNIIEISLPWSIAAILGSALAIFIAFRNQSSYGRWWEARTIWGGIINNSRILARQIINNVDASVETGKIKVEEGTVFKKELLYRQIAFAHALRIHLRKETDFGVLKDFISENEFADIVKRENKPNILLTNQGKRIKDGISKDYLGAFDNISIEPNMASFNNWQGACERIKNTPLPMNYQYFTKLFLYVFIFILPLSLLNDFEKLKVEYLIVPVSFIISFVFAVMNRVGEINENPFENQMQDIPMTALCNTIERDLKEMLNEGNLPKKVIADTNGFLY